MSFPYSFPNLVPRAFPSKNTHFLRERPWERGWARVEVGFSFGVSVTVSVLSIRVRVVVVFTKNVVKKVSPV